MSDELDRALRRVSAERYAPPPRQMRPSRRPATETELAAFDAEWLALDNKPIRRGSVTSKP
jgi:hypothetical protein